MDELVAFLRARYDEVAALAASATQDTTGRWTARETDWGGGPVVEDECGALILPTDGGARPYQYQHIAAHGPARVLREVEAKRRLVALHAPVTLRRRVGDQMGDVVACEYDTDPDGMGWIDYPCETLRLLALPYADHPEYRAEWRP